MVSDQEIASCVASLLQSTTAGGTATAEASLAAVVQQAEAKLGMDLSHKADFIRSQMDLFFGPRLPPSSKTPPPQSQPVMMPLPASTSVALQPAQIIFQAMPAHVTAAAAGTASQQPPAVPAMAFYPPPPLAFRYANTMGGTVTFQQPSTMVGAAGMGAAAVGGAAGAQATDPQDRLSFSLESLLALH